MKFVTTSYTNKNEILKFADHFVAVAVTVEKDGVSVNGDGKYIMPAGTIIGGGALASESQNVSAAAANSLLTELDVADAELVFTAKTLETVKVAYIDPSGNDQALAVSISGDTINVSLATGPAGAITSTAAEVKAAIEAHLVANALVDVTYPSTDDGSGTVKAMTAAELTGGVVPEGILLNDIDVTYGDAPGAMLIHGFVDVSKITAVQAIPQLARDILNGIHWVE